MESNKPYKAEGSCSNVLRLSSDYPFNAPEQAEEPNLHARYTASRLQIEKLAMT